MYPYVFFVIVPIIGTKVKSFKFFVPIYGTKVNKRASFVQYDMTITKKLNIIEILNYYHSFGIEYIDEANYRNIRFNKYLLPNKYSQLKEYSKNCTLCEISKHKHSFEFDYGCKNSKIYIIGLDNSIMLNKLQSESFINIVLKTLNVRFEDVYITSIIKCFSFNDIKKSENIINTCKNYILTQLEINKPNLIITLGDAFNILMKSNDDILNISGNEYSYNNIKLIPLMDIYFIMKNPSYNERMIFDLNKIRKIMENR